MKIHVWKKIREFLPDCGEAQRVVNFVKFVKIYFTAGFNISIK